MSVTLQFHLTSAGQLAAWNARKTGLTLDLTHVQLGSGNRVPNGMEVALVRAQETAPIIAGSQVSASQVRMSALFSSNTGLDVNEIGLWAGNPANAGAILFGYWSQAAGSVAVKSPGVDFVFTHDLVIDGAVPAGSINVVIDSSQASAMALLAAHEAAPNPHPNYALASSLEALIPAGTLMFFPTATPPASFVKANGAALPRAVYWRLFSAIGIQYGAGNGITTFNVPDFRGEFVRGWDDGRGVDPGRILGSAQGDEIKAHNHYPPAGVDGWVSAQFWGDGAFDGSRFVGPGERNPVNTPTANTGGTETRPRNVAMLACIKF